MSGTVIAILSLYRLLDNVPWKETQKLIYWRSCGCLDAIEKLNKGEEVKLGGQHIKYYKDIAEHFGANKSEISKLKKQARKSQAGYSRNSGKTKRNRMEADWIQVSAFLLCRWYMNLPLFHLLYIGGLSSIFWSVLCITGSRKCGCECSCLSPSDPRKSG